MIDFTNAQVPAPQTWQEFEDLCADLWKEIWKDPGTQKNGRSGQQQHGVDVFGRPDQGNDYEGVQCKGKDGRYGQQVTEAELKAEIEKAKTFHPPLKRFVLATTAQSDQKIQLIARKITSKHLAARLFPVEVLSWDEIQRRLADHPKVIDKYYRFGPSQQKISEDISLLQESQLSHEINADRRQAEIIEAIQKTALYQNIAAQPEAGSTNPIDEFLNEQIDQCREWINSQKPLQALDELQRIQKKYWEKVTDRTKFRILTNIAAANLNLGQIELAVAGFFDAITFDPDDERGLCNIAFAHLLKGQNSEAFYAAQKTIQAFPESARGYSLLVAASAANPEIIDPMVLVPETLLENSETAYAFGRFYTMRDDCESSLEWMKKAYVLDEKGLEARAGYAEALLSNVLQDETVSKGRCLSQDQESDVVLARDLLVSVWDDVKATDVAKRFMVHVHNLISAEGILHNIDNAIAIANDAIQIDPNYGMIKRQLALYFMEKGEFESAASTLETLPDNSYEEKSLMHAEALIESGQPDKALEKVEWFLETHPDSEHSPSALRLLVHLQQILKGNETAIEETLKLLEKRPDDVLLLAQLSEMYLAEDMPEEAKKCVRKAHETITETSVYAEKFIVADVLYKHGFHVEAAILFGELAGDGGDSFPLKQLFRCYLKSDQRRAALSKLAKLPDEVREKPFYLMIAGILHRRAGNLEEAKRNFEGYLQLVPGDLQVFLGWAETAKVLGAMDELRHALESLGSFPNASTQHLMQLSHLLDQSGYIDKAIVIAYETLRQNMHDPKAHFGYMGLLLQGQTGQTDLTKKTIDIDSAFLVEGKMLPRRWFVIEAEKKPEFDLGEIPPDHPVAVAVLGKSVGETVIVNDKFFSSNEIRICEIKHKYLHVLHQSMETFEQRFPEEQALIRVPVPMTPEGEEDFQFIKEMTAQKRESSLQILDLYKKNALPLCLVAKMSGINSLEILPSLAVRKDVTIRCCDGSYIEREQAFRLIDNPSKGFVIDPITLHSIFLLGVQETVLKVVKKIGITRSSFDLIDSVVEERKKFLPAGFMTIGYEDGQLTRQELTPEEVSGGIKRLEEMRKWAEDNCDLLEAIPTKDPSDKYLQIADAMPDAFYDTMLAASGADRYLLSDDQHFRTLGKELCQIEGCWIQPILMKAVDANYMSTEEYATTITNLIRANFYFVTINSDVLAFVAQKTSWDVRHQDFVDLANTLGQEGSDIASSMRVSTEFLKMAWKAPIPWWTKKNYLLSVINILVENNWDKVSSLLKAFHLMVRVIPNDQKEKQVYLETLRDWCIGHFIKYPV